MMSSLRQTLLATLRQGSCPALPTHIPIIIGEIGALLAGDRAAFERVTVFGPLRVHEALYSALSFCMGPNVGRKCGPTLLGRYDYGP